MAPQLLFVRQPKGVAVTQYPLHDSPQNAERRNSWMLRAGIGLAVLSLALTTSGSAASAATTVAASQPGDHTVTNGPISITVPASASFQVGTVTTMVSWCGLAQPYVWTTANVGLAWSARSTAGPIVGYDLYELYGEGPSPWQSTSVPVLNDWISNYDASCGGGDGLYGWYIVARDSLGNTVQAEVDSPLDVTRYDNTNANAIDGVQLGTWTYTGKWAVSNCACADGYRQTYTTAKSATASYTFTATLGQHFALMMAEGPGRGSFKIYQDGVLKATVSTHVGVNTNRVITWASTALTAGSHVFKVVNLATTGHARIDINAAMTD